MLRSNHNSGFYLRLWHPWHQANKINNKFTVGVSNHRQIGIDPFRNFLRKLNIDLILSLRFVLLSSAMAL